MVVYEQVGPSAVVVAFSAAYVVCTLLFIVVSAIAKAISRYRWKLYAHRVTKQWLKEHKIQQIKDSE